MWCTPFVWYGVNFADDDLKGKYHKLSELSSKTRDQLLVQYPPFESDEPNLQDRIEVYDLNRDWPEGRGIFYNSNKTFIVWVNENEHLQIISRDQGCDIKRVFEKVER